MFHTAAASWCWRWRSPSTWASMSNRRRADAPLDIARQYFSPDEAATLFALSTEFQSRRFFDLWTLKESYLKARKRGLSIPLDQFGFELDDPGRVTLHLQPGLGDRFVPMAVLAIRRRRRRRHRPLRRPVAGTAHRGPLDGSGRGRVGPRIEVHPPIGGVRSHDRRSIGIACGALNLPHEPEGDVIVHSHLAMSASAAGPTSDPRRAFSR